MYQIRLSRWFLVVAVVMSFNVISTSAEGRRDSSMTDVYTGFNFRDYDDSGVDESASWVLIKACWGSNPNLSVNGWETQLWHVYRWRPDSMIGSVGGLCDGSVHGRPDPGVGTFHWTLSWYRNASFYNSFNTNSVSYGW